MATQFVFIVKISAMENMFIFYTMYFLSARKSFLLEILTSHNNLYSGCFWSSSKYQLCKPIAAQKRVFESFSGHETKAMEPWNGTD